ncbi:MAG: hypothetical protein RL481_1527 [Pseudomonadota bacterium]
MRARDQRNRLWKTPHKASSLHIHLKAPIWGAFGLPDYGDKLRCAIDAADPGAVPGSSTTFLDFEANDGAELGSTCVEKHCFCPA